MGINLENLFAYHPPKNDQAGRYDKIRAAALTFAETIVENTPKSAEQTLSIRAVHSAMMHANSSIGINETDASAKDGIDMSGY